MTTDERIERLEREVHRWQIVSAIVAAVLAVGLVVCVTAGPRKWGTVKAREFQMVDGFGIVRVTLFMSKDGPAFLMYDARGRMLDSHVVPSF